MVCERWNAIFDSKDASPFHETLYLDIERDVNWAKVATRSSSSSAAASAGEGRGPRRDLRPVTRARARAREWALREYPIVHASRDIQLKSLEVLNLGYNDPLQIDASSFDFLIEGCPRLLGSSWEP